MSERAECVRCHGKGRLWIVDHPDAFGREIECPGCGGNCTATPERNHETREALMVCGAMWERVPPPPITITFVNTAERYVKTDEDGLITFDELHAGWRPA